MTRTGEDRAWPQGPDGCSVLRDPGALGEGYSALGAEGGGLRGLLHSSCCATFTVSAVLFQNRRKLKGDSTAWNVPPWPQARVCSPLSPHSTWEVKRASLFAAPLTNEAELALGFLSAAGARGCCLHRWTEASGAPGDELCCPYQPVCTGHSWARIPVITRNMECKCSVSGLRQGPSSIPQITAGPALGRLGLRQTRAVQGAARSDLMVSAAHFQESCIPGKLIRLPTPLQISPCPYGQTVQS